MSAMRKLRLECLLVTAQRLARAMLYAGGIGAAALAAGCAPGDVEFNGKIFDAMGLNSTGGGNKDVKMAERAPLVPPPSRDHLPEPGSGSEEETAALAEIKDPDAARNQSKADLERQQAEYCRKHYDPLVATGDDVRASAVKGPLGDCRPSILSVVSKPSGSSGGTSN